jgi:hypothetical protein
MSLRHHFRFHWTFLLIAALIPLVELILPGNHHFGDLLRPVFIMAIDRKSVV